MNQKQQQQWRDQDYSASIQRIVLIQSWYKGIFTRGKVKKMCKDFYKREMIIKELLETQEKYIRDISIVISDFQGPLLNKKIISKEQSNTIFSNIDQIRRLNQLFFATFFTQAQNYFHYKIIFEKVQKEIHFFKLYFEYFNNFNNSSLLIDKLSQSRKDLRQFLNTIRINPKYQLLTLKDYLIKPVQRLPKYVLIMKQIKKRTPQCHPDYKNIDRVLRMFAQVNHSNNEKLNRVVNSYKINELQRKLMLPHTISQPGAQFITEEPVTTLNNDGYTVQCNMYLLNSAIIIAKKVKDRQIFLLSVPFKNGGGIIMFNDEHYFYKDSFTVQNGQGDSCTFICNSSEQKDALVQKIFNELMKAEQKNYEKLTALCSVKNKDGVQFLQKMSRLDLLPEVQILGTQERNDPMFKYTVYIIQVRIKNIKQKLFLRFSQLLQIQKTIADEYGLNIKNYLVKNSWLMNHKPKLIEARKMAIQRFLKELLSKQEIIERGQEILVQLGLSNEFYKLPSKYKGTDDLLKKSAVSQRSTSSQDNSKRSVCKLKRMSIFQAIEAQKQFEIKKNRGTRSKRMSIQQILQANELNLGHYTRYTQIMNDKCQNDDDYITLDVLIPWIQNDKGFVKEKVTLRRDQRVICLIQKLAQQIHLKYYKDFRLYLERQYAGRLLDADESIIKVYEQIKNSKYQLLLKKMIYIDPQMQEREIRGDRIRLKIISSQIIYDCKKDKYLFNYNKILKLAILVGLTQIFADHEEDEVEDIDEFVKNELIKRCDMAIKIREMVVSEYTEFHDAISTWKNDYEQNFTKVFKKITKIGRQNSIVFRTSGIKDVQKQFNTTQISQLAAISIIMQMKNDIFYGSISFVVQISQWFRKTLKEINKSSEEQQCQQGFQNRNCWLIVKYNEIHLYSISLKHRLYSFNYQDIIKMETYPSSFYLYLRQKEVDFIKLKATNSYSIRQIITYYRHYNQMVNKIQEDEYFEDSVIEMLKQKEYMRSGQN